MVEAGDFPRTRATVNEGLGKLHVGAQIFASVEGRVVLNFAVGLARAEPAVEMTRDTLMLWLSAGKPITAAAMGILMDRGLIGLDDPVARHIPEFGANGKEAITLRHILTHTAGIRGIDPGYPFVTWEETLRKICAMKLERDWLPGQRAGYHTVTSWYVLGELINRLTAMEHTAWIRENLLLPLNMRDTHLAMTAAEYEGYGERIGYLYDTTVTPPKPLANYDTEQAAMRSRPAASVRGPMRELGNFYEMLRQGGVFRGRRILESATVAAMISRQRVGMFDQTFRQMIDWGLGVILNSTEYGPAIPYQFGPYASRETFGHGGSQSSTGFCDPARGLVAALIFNGCCGEAAHDRRLRSVLKGLYEDLGLRN